MMLVDCQTCPLTAIPIRPGASVDAADAVTAALDRAERRAVSAFLAAGLVTTATANAARAELDPVEQAPRHGARRAV
jgi:hypothetical protein